MTQPPSFADEMGRTLREAYDRLLQQRLDAGGTPLVDGYVTSEEVANKATAFLSVSCCLMTDETGVNHCDHPPRVYPRPPWHKRARWWLSGRWSSLRMRLGSWVAGTDLNERDDW